MSNQFFSIIGSNGVAVMSSLEKAEKMKKYIKNALIYELPNFESAESFALLKYAASIPSGRYCPSYLMLDRPLFAKNFRGNSWKKAKHV